MGGARGVISKHNLWIYIYIYVYIMYVYVYTYIYIYIYIYIVNNINIWSFWGLDCSKTSRTLFFGS